MDKGFIKLNRKSFAHKFWTKARVLSEFEAWIDLIQSARFDEAVKIEYIDGREIKYGRGQYPASIRFLAKKWSWGDQKVRSFLNELKRDGSIKTDSSQGMNIITLCKYERYNSVYFDENTANNTGDNIDIYLILKELQQLKTQLSTQQITQSQHSGNTNNKKDNKEKVNNTPTPPKGDFPELSEKEKQLLDFEKQLKQKESELKAAQENASKPPRKPKKKDKVDTYLNSQAREIFENHVKVVFETDYYWTPKDAGNMSLLLQKLTFARKKKNFSLDDDSVLNALKVFLSTIKDGWLFENFTVAKINSQFNEIIAKAKNANKSTNQKEEQIRVGAGLTIL